MHQLRSVLAVAHQVGDVVDHGKLGVDDGMRATGAAHGEMTDRQSVADIDGLPRLAELGGGLRIGIQRGVRVGLDQCRQPLGVGVVGMLVGDQDRRQTGDALEAVREGAGVEQHGGLRAGPVGEARQQAGMAEVCELHDLMHTRCGRLGVRGASARCRRR